jgi:hypothetical protein
MLRALDFLGLAKWPMLVLVTIAPAIAYTQWLPPAPRMTPIATMTIMEQQYRVDGLIEEDGEQLLSIRPLVALGAAAPQIRVVEAGWDVEGDAGNWQEGAFEAGAAVVVLARRPAEAASFTIRMEDVEREDAVAVVRMTPLR